MPRTVGAGQWFPLFRSVLEQDDQTRSEIFAMLVQRFTNEEIADRLRLANQTVKNHVSSVLRKVGARNRNELLRRAVEGWPAA
ncbi:helix-turn-helix domain-containing protein [Allosalinactinospora lopnorensis]|uniref:helix-turn-helix domain-containing protein n=1 Tax=Allosalinactinospora lopnorensis TaxID=1352348 RepID=UPI000B1BFD22|nr:helix-turn-helix transcriptional regulator [Allosalinactinospora lopnorensis]